MSNYCPECGAGKNEDGTFQLHKDFPVLDATNCKTCVGRMKEGMRKLGQEAGRRYREYIFNAINKFGNKED